MKPILQFQIALGCLLSSAAFATEASSAPDALPAPWDKEKVSYALGMNLGLLRQQSAVQDTNTDMHSYIDGLQDAINGKTARLKDAEANELFKRISTQGLDGQSAEDKKLVSYAVGMRTGGQIKRDYADADAKTMVDAINDVLEARPLKLKESMLQAILQQAQAWGKLQLGQKNKIEGEAFLATNAKEPGVQSLPGGVQYRVIKTGSGEIPKSNDMVFIKYKGTFVNGTQFHRHGHFLTRACGGLKGWQEAIQKMKVGSRWKLYLPGDLAYGEEGESRYNIGPNSALIYDLELIAIAPQDAEFGHGRLGHAMEDADDPHAWDNWDDAATQASASSSRAEATQTARQ